MVSRSSDSALGTRHSLLGSIVHFSLRFRGVVIALAVLALGYGLWSLTHWIRKYVEQRGTSGQVRKHVIERLSHCFG